MRFLLLGYGSIGARHAAILRGMGHEVVAVDPDPARGADYASVYNKGMSQRRETPRLAVEEHDFDGVLDCTPPDVRYGYCITTGRALFVEKPIGYLPLPYYKPVQSGFCYHYLPALAQFVNVLQLQPLAHLLIVGGQNLQDWHKQDYRARKYWGVATDSLPHSLYIARWVLGDYRLLGSFTGRFSDLEIETEDTAGVLLLSDQNVPCYCEADYLREPRLFFIEAITNAGKRRYWEFDPAEAPEMYRRQMETFVNLCSGEDAGRYPDLQDGMAVQQILDGVK